MAIFLSGGDDVGTLAGFDLSSNNTAAAVDTALTGDFVIIKASEGLTYVWAGGQTVASRARAAGELGGWYHYAHVANDPAAEARAFVAAAKAQPGETLWLDFEPYNQPEPDSAYPAWIITFCATVEQLAVAPGIYLNLDMMRRIAAVATPAQLKAIQARRLWLASYTSSIPTLPTGWPEPTVWQWTDANGLDKNTFYGDATLWRSLGIPGDDMALDQSDIDKIVSGVLDAVIPKMPAGTDKTSLRLTTQWTQNLFDSLSNRVAALEAAVKTPPAATVDTAALAKAVADELAARMES